MEFTINDNLNIDLESQYSKIRNYYSKKVKINSFEDIYNIKEELGNGFIKIYKLKNGLSITVYNILFKEDIITNYNLSDKYFELEYCISGSMDIWEENKEKISVIEGEISISKDRNTKGKVIYNKNKPYKGISITGNSESILECFGSIGKEFWNETIGALDEKTRDEYYKGKKVSPDITNIFLEIYNVNMPSKGKIIYIESKVTELLSILMSYEIKEDFKSIQLEDYEIEKIKKIPNILMDNIFSPLTIEDLSKLLSINRNKLNEGFKLIYNDTIYNHHRSTCLERSKLELRNTDKSVYAIAFDIGYSSPSNYIYAFKRKYNITPSEYRKKTKKLS